MGRPWARILGIMPLVLAMVAPQSPNARPGWGVGCTTSPWAPLPTLLHPPHGRGTPTARAPYTVRCSALRATPTSPTSPPSQEDMTETLSQRSDDSFGGEADAEWPPGVPGGADVSTHAYLSQCLALGDNAVRSIADRHPQVLALNVDNDVIPTLRYLVDALELDPGMTRSVVQKQPEVLRLSVSADLVVTLDWFNSTLGLSGHKLGTLVARYPPLLCHSIRGVLGPKVECVEIDAGMTKADVRKVTMKVPEWFGEEVALKLDLLGDELGLDRPDLRKLLLVCPSVLLASLNETLRPKVSYMRNELGFSKKEACVVVHRQANFLLYNDTNLSNFVAYLRADLGFSSVEAKRVLYQQPKVAASDLEFHVKPMVARIREVFALEPEELRKVIVARPQILKMQGRIDDRLQSLAGLGFEGKLLAQAVKILPSLLTYNVERNLKPKLEFIAQVTGCTREEVVEACCERPLILGSSLENRIRPRARELQELARELRRQEREARLPGSGGGREGPWVGRENEEGELLVDLSDLTNCCSCSKSADVFERWLEIARSEGLRKLGSRWSSRKRVSGEGANGA